MRQENKFLSDLKVEIIDSWQRTHYLKEEWDELVSFVKVEHPCLTYDWFSLWYSSFKPIENACIIVLRNYDGQLRALFPGFKQRRQIGGLPIHIFSFAATVDSLFGGIIARAGDHRAIQAALQAPVKLLRPTPQLVVLPMVPDNSDTAAVIQQHCPKNFGRRIEHIAGDVPIISMSLGWEQYYAGRSANTRKNIRKSQALFHKIGRLVFEEVSVAERSDEVVARLRRLDALSWQGQQGTGLFSTPDRERFYGAIVSCRYPGLEARVYFATINNQDIAYSITLTKGKSRCGFKTGYDPDYAYCSPGSVLMCHVIERAVADGIQYFDLGDGRNDEKRRWETSRIQNKNWWVFNRRSLRGLALEQMVKFHDFRKKGKL